MRLHYKLVPDFFTFYHFNVKKRNHWTKKHPFRCTFTPSTCYKNVNFCLSLQTDNSSKNERTEKKKTHENNTNKLWKNICFILLDIFAKQIFARANFHYVSCNVSMSPFLCPLLIFFVHYTYTRRACCVFIVFLSVWIADSCSAYKTVLLTSVSPLEKFHFITWFSNIFLSFMCAAHNAAEENSCLNIWCVRWRTLQQDQWKMTKMKIFINHW